MRERTRHIRAPDGRGVALTEVTPRGVAGSDFSSSSSSSSRSSSSSDSDSPAPAFLLVHGFAQNRRTFTTSPFTRTLLELGARVFVAELRGHGLSRRPEDEKARSTVRTLLDLDLPVLVEATAEASRSRRVHLVGHSLGGMLGYALLARRDDLASLTTFGSPLVLGAGRPLLRAASLALGPFFGRLSSDVPIDVGLRALANVLSRRERGMAIRAIQWMLGLVNPERVGPRAARQVLSQGDPESSAILRELAEMAIARSSRLSGVDLVEAVRQSRIPVAAVVGGRDAFASLDSVAPMKQAGHLGPRLVLEVPRGAHVDIVLGPGSVALASRIWSFLNESGALQSTQNEKLG